MIRLVSTTRRLIQKTARNSVFGTVNLRCFSFGMGNIMGSEESNMGGAQKNGVAETHYVLKGNRIQPPFPEGIQTCVFGTGCFWGTVGWSRMQMTQNAFPIKRPILLMLRCNIIGGFIPYDYTCVYMPFHLQEKGFWRMPGGMRDAFIFVPQFLLKKYKQYNCLVY